MYELSEKDRLELSRFIELTYGIKMPVQKKELLQSRLQKRALNLGYPTIRQYMDFLFSPAGRDSELDHFAAIVSTHKTEFFREMEHFTVLRDRILPELTADGNLGKYEPLVAWSSASSTGEEVYSIAMTTHSYYKRNGNAYPMVKVIGTDISDDIVEIARNGVYPDSALTSIPSEYKSYAMVSKDPKRRAIRVVPEIRTLTDFRRQNLMDTQYKVKKGIHIIFCRNVLIYFDRPTQQAILTKLAGLLAPGGYLLIGHSESMAGITLPVELIQPTIFRKLED